MNPDAFCRFIGPENLGKALIDDELVSCLLDNGAQLNFITPTYTQEWGIDIMSLDYLVEEIGGAIPLIRGLGSISVEPIGFVMMNIKVPDVAGYDKDQITIVMDDPGMMEWPVILGTPTLYQVMEVIKESQISKLAVPWASLRVSWLMRDILAKLGQVVVNDIANKPIAPLHVDEVVRVASKCTVPPFGHKAIHGKVNLILHSYKMNMMTHGLEKWSPSLPLGIDVQTVYATLADGSNRITVVLRNNTRDWLEIKKGVPIARMVAANEVPKVTNLFSVEQTKETSTLSETERQDLLLEKLDLSSLEAWPQEQAEQAHSLLKEYHDIFSLEKRDMGHTNTTKHKIVLKDPDTLPFKERFRRIPPPQLDEVREHLKLMLDTGVIRPSNSPWCNAVVLVRKKDGSLHFCIDFRKLNSLTVKDSHPLPCICETLESLAGAAHFSMFDMNSGFWQVPMDEESKQYTAFTLGSMGLYECESMPFGLCNALPTFQRLMQNCLGKLNLTYCLIYLDDVIVFSDMPDEHLRRMRVVFNRLHEHSLKLKPSKCEVFKSEINYLAHHVSWKGVLPSKKNLESIAQCPPPDKYQKGKENMVAEFLSWMNERLPEEEVQEYLNQIPHPGVKAVFNNAITPIEERAEQGVRPTPDCQEGSQEVMVETRPARLATTNVTNWKQEQKEDPVLYQVAKHLRVPRETFKAALHKVLDKKATAAYVKAKEQLLIKNGLLYWKTWQGQADEIVFQFVVPQRHRGAALGGCHREAAHQGQRRSAALMQECFWWPGMT